MEGMPSISAGGGGPSWASGQATGMGGQGNSGWVLNFGGSSSDGPAMPRTAAYQFGPFGMPQFSAIGAGAAGLGGQAAGVSPMLLLAGLVVLALVLRK